MEVPTPDPSKLLQSWMEWERGEVTPGRVMANMKTGGLRLLLEELSSAGGAPPAGPGVAPPGRGAVLPDAAGPGPSPGSPEPGASGPDGAPGTVGGQPSSWAPVV
ncbi:MAG: hypothetical protein ABSE77_16535 [Acidimicrobiales bacterium]|jgi:hypothetical protein